MRPLVWTEIATLASISAVLTSPARGQTPLNVIRLEQPDAQDFARYYPENAKNRSISGRAALDCIVNADGRLSCTAHFKTPEGWGFGEASLRISRHFRMAAHTRDGLPTAGGRIRRTIRWAIN